MKVKVKVKHAPLNQVEYFLNEALSEALADLDSAHREIEKLFQENKDLRVSESHLRDDLAYAQARIEKLNDQITASETDTAFWKKSAAENAELVSEAIAEANSWENSAHEQGERVQEQSDTIAHLEAQLAAMCKRNDKLQFDVTYWKAKAEEATAELVKCDIGHYQKEIDEWQMTANTLSDKMCKLQEEFAELQIEHQELGEDYDALVKTKCDYAEEFDRLRQENKRLRDQMSLQEFMRQFIEMTREAVQNEFPDSSNS